MYSLENEIVDCYAVLEPSLQRWLKAVGLPFEVAGGTKWYMGANITPVMLNIPRAECQLASTNFLFYEYLHMPQGFEFDI
jgi:N-acyl-L-homoserine lactone synthetase